MIGLFIVACAGFVIGVGFGMWAGLWTCGKDHE